MADGLFFLGTAIEQTTPVFVPLSIFYPPQCAICNAEVDPGSVCCISCHPLLEAERLQSAGRCRRCFLPVTVGSCQFCNGRVRSFDSHLSLYRMSAAWRRLLHRWKFDNDRGAWRAFQPGLQTIQARLGKLRFDRIGWIESGRAGWQKRAYQPCADPARFLAQALGLPCGGDLCKRSGGRQSSRNFGDRFLALRGTLDCKGRQLQDCRRYLLLEDVFTTGATANAAAAALKKNGVLTVTILSLLLREEAFD